MFDQVMDTFRKATESALQLQQQVLRNWTQLWDHPPGGDGPAAALPFVEQLYSCNRQVAEAVTDLLKKHRETLDAQYALGIQALEEAFRVGESKDPAEFLKRVEELWRHSFDCLKAVADDQIRGFQAATERWGEVVKGGAGASPG